jgi:GT2 family glycosyltransferase
MHQHSGLVDLVIVDNGSRPDEWRQIAAALKPWGKRAQVLRNEENSGYPIAANQGLRAARGDVIWLINPDVDIRADDWHLPVLDFLAANPRVGIVCGCENERAYRFDRRHGAVGQLAAGDHVNGCSFAIRRACWWMVGDLDEAFTPGLLEETDFCLRAWRQGWESWMVPVALRHEHRSQVVAANGDVWRDEWKAKNRAYFSEKWAGVYGEVSGAAIWPPI